MRILITTGLYPPEIGGPATYAKMLEVHLPSRGIEPSMLPFSTVRHLPKIVRHVTYMVKCLLLARTVDTIFAQDPVSVGLPSFLAARMLGKRFLLRVGGDYAWEQGRLRFGVTDSLEAFSCGKGHYHVIVHLLKRVQAYVASRAERVSVQSAFMKKVVACWGIPQEKITVIPNGFSADVAIPDKKSSRDLLKVEGTIAVSAGRLVPWKGFAGVIEIVSEIAKRVPDFVLYIIGDGPDDEKLQGIVAKRRLTGRVFFTGRLDKEALMCYLCAADVFILNTQYEGFSNQLLEVYAAGTPVVTTDIGGNQDVVAHGVSGLLVSPDDRDALIDAIVRVLEDADLASQLIVGGRDKVREFSVERMVAETKKFLCCL